MRHPYGKTRDDGEVTHHNCDTMSCLLWTNRHSGGTTRQIDEMMRHIAEEMSHTAEEMRHSYRVTHYGGERQCYIVDITRSNDDMTRCLDDLNARTNVVKR